MTMVVLMRYSMGFGTFSFNTLLPFHGHTCPTPSPLSSSKSILQFGSHHPFWPWQTQQFVTGEELLAISQTAPATPTLQCWSPA